MCFTATRLYRRFTGIRDEYFKLVGRFGNKGQLESGGRTPTAMQHLKLRLFAFLQPHYHGNKQDIRRGCEGPVSSDEVSNSEGTRSRSRSRSPTSRCSSPRGTRRPSTVDQVAVQGKGKGKGKGKSSKSADLQTDIRQFLQHIDLQRQPASATTMVSKLGMKCNKTCCCLILYEI